MTLNRFRPWITPLVIGSFLLLASTGILMFFHLDAGLNKAAHEWLSWIFVAGVGLHIGLNQMGFKRYLQSGTGRAVIGAFAAVLALSFLPLGGESKPPFAAPVQALARAPLPLVAQVAGVSVAEVRQRLAVKGIQVQGEGQSIADVVGPDLGAQVRALNVATAR